MHDQSIVLAIFVVYGLGNGSKKGSWVGIIESSNYFTTS
jgi:hypothetical protein